MSFESRDNTREDERIEILGELHGEVTVFQSVVIKELSRGGAQIESAFPLLLNSLHDFRLVLGDRSVIAKARIAHCHISDVDQELVVYRAGIEFVEPSAHVSAAISGFLETIREGRKT